ncbi:hypothetical protein Tco_1402494 [Tanacetum coccineum]
MDVPDLVQYVQASRSRKLRCRAQLQHRQDHLIHTYLKQEGSSQNFGQIGITTGALSSHTKVTTKWDRRGKQNPPEQSWLSILLSKQCNVDGSGCLEPRSIWFCLQSVSVRMLGLTIA